jgi:hypothetical protein
MVDCRLLCSPPWRATSLIDPVPPDWRTPIARCEVCGRRVKQPSRSIINGRIVCAIHNPRPDQRAQRRDDRPRRPDFDRGEGGPPPMRRPEPVGAGVAGAPVPGVQPATAVAAAVPVVSSPDAATPAETAVSSPGADAGAEPATPSGATVESPLPAAPAPETSPAEAPVVSAEPSGAEAPPTTTSAAPVAEPAAARVEDAVPVAESPAPGAEDAAPSVTKDPAR